MSQQYNKGQKKKRRIRYLRRRKDREKKVAKSGTAKPASAS